eukprot:m.190238 g.190238  ORF g.190238 m.190238 type:complete len:373 (-) comp14812_c1_seq2:3592-4710(-)
MMKQRRSPLGHGAIVDQEVNEYQLDSGSERSGDEEDLSLLSDSGDNLGDVTGVVSLQDLLQLVSTASYQGIQLMLDPKSQYVLMAQRYFMQQYGIDASPSTRRDELSRAEILLESIVYLTYRLMLLGLSTRNIHKILEMVHGIQSELIPDGSTLDQVADLVHKTLLSCRGAPTHVLQACFTLVRQTVLQHHSLYTDVIRMDRQIMWHTPRFEIYNVPKVGNLRNALTVQAWEEKQRVEAELEEVRLATEAQQEALRHESRLSVANVLRQFGDGDISVDEVVEATLAETAPLMHKHRRMTEELSSREHALQQRRSSIATPGLLSAQQSTDRLWSAGRSSTSPSKSASSSQSRAQSRAQSKRASRAGHRASAQS